MKNLVEEHGAENLVVVYGINQPANIRIMAQTFKHGDPSFAGPLAGVALNLESYHILELQTHIPQEIWAKEMAMYELEIEEKLRITIGNIMEEVRSS